MLTQPSTFPRCFPLGSGCRMLENQEQEELTTVRVQDPRLQNEGSWNSYVDYKIFLHTNSKAFTAKTSCVRRRYREFVWLRKQLQKNAGLVVVQNVVLLSDSQLHLFLQSQLSVPEIEACVQGQSPLTVTDAILRYAMSNCGWVQEEDTRPVLVAGAELYGSCAGLGSPPVRSCLKPPSRWSGFGMEDNHSDSLDSPTEQPETE
ncbi:sorting nexin-11 isoform X3 [Chelonoidis abingdonii]|uniref:sorting nexin-11 isoform X3 n=1 Tax=Chelonoidis abingdonii TaxID=106734 RepID=UPI0013F23B9E|nr:sorting nexin-11 isoform X3 [Chelonoidis abingdonii]